VTGPAAPAWREALAGLADDAVTALVTVQCGMDWLRPGAFAVRDEIDEAVMAAARARAGLRIDRIVLHNLPVLDSVPPAELAALNDAHADWMYRLAATGALLAPALRPRVHRLIVRGAERSLGVVDGIALRRDRTWSDPDTAAALEVLARGTTPLTGYDLDLDGPFGDADPSSYL
jgi:hypothetical protein